MQDSGQPADAPIDRFHLVGTVLDRKFRVEKLVAEGGFGVVYQGTHLTLDKPIAIKVLKTPPEYNDQARAAFIEKFALEAKTIARISHPNIVQVHDFGASLMPDNAVAPWMVLEWLTGSTLEDVLNHRRGAGGRSPAETLALLKPVFEALAYVHDEGVAHRDIKPANIMVVQGRRGYQLRLMDFGIAKLMEANETVGSGATHTRNQMNAFSPQYAAPEQLTAMRTGPWTDVHAMALITVETLLDRPPYRGGDLGELFTEVLAPVRPTPAKFGFNVGAWEPVLARALAVKADERFHHMAEFLAALEAALPASAMAPGGHVTGPYQLAQSSPGYNPITSPQGFATGPTGAVPNVTSPTTMRSAAMTMDVAGRAPAKSRAPLIAGLGFLALAGLGGIGLMIHGRIYGNAAVRATVRPIAQSPVQAGAAGGPQPTPLASAPPSVSPAAPVVVPPPAAPVAVVAPPTAPAAADPAAPDAGGGRTPHRAHGTASGGHHRVELE